VVLDGDAFTVVGVMRPGIDFPFEIQVWTLSLHGVPGHPLRPFEDPTNIRASLYLGMCGRLNANASLEQASSEQRAIFERLRIAYPTARARLTRSVRRPSGFVLTS
jgi:hypothetical protein